MTSSDHQFPRAIGPTATATTSRGTPSAPPASFMRRRVPFLFSVRFGLTAWYAVVLILTLALSGVALRLLLMRSLRDDAEMRLFRAAGMVESQITLRTDRDSSGRELTTVDYAPSFDIGSLVLSGMTVVVIDIREPIPDFLWGSFAEYWPTSDDRIEYAQRTEPFYVTDEVAGQSFLGYVYPIMTSTANGEQRLAGLILTGESLEGRDRVLEILNQVTMIAGIAGVVIATYGGWLLAGRALAPVNRIMTSADVIAKEKGAASFSGRIDIPPTGDEIAQLAVAFNDLLDRVQAALTAQRRFVGDASHELRTPLTSIKGNVEVLQRQIASGRASDPADISDALADVHREADRMGRLVDDLLVLARTDADALGSLVTLDVVSLDILAQEAARTAEALVQGQEFVLHTPYPVPVHGDGDRLVQLMLILLDNALRHTPPDGKVTLSISTDEDPNTGQPCGRIDVVDTGKGISEDHMAHLFERFYRAEGSRSRTDGGTGLGLSIALAIARSHNGWIDIESAEGQGARFTTWIPLSVDPDEMVTSQANERPTSRRLARVPRLRRADAAQGDATTST